MIQENNNKEKGKEECKMGGSINQCFRIINNRSGGSLFHRWVGQLLAGGNIQKQIEGGKELPTVVIGDILSDHNL